ncbi:MAG TPA: DMT family transporter [Caulobacteraceae bacterium]
MVQRLWDQPYLLLVLTTLGWGGNAVASRMAVGQISPMTLTSARWGLVLGLLLLICRRQVMAGLPALRRQWVALTLMGATGFTIFNALNYVAAHYTSAVNLSITQGTVPLLVLIGGLIAHKAPVKPRQLGGAALALVGVAIVASGGKLEALARLHFNNGDLLMFTAAILYSGYTVALRDRGDGGGAGQIAFFFGMAVAAFLTSLPLVAVEAATGGFQAPTPKGLAILVFIALAPSFMSALFFMRAVSLIGPARAGLFFNLVPVFGAILAVLVLGEPMGLHQILALALVLGGIAVAERRPRAAPATI